MYISEAIKYIGVTDLHKDLFEGQYKVPNGITYNSYVILDEKVAVLDTVDAGFTTEWLGNLEAVLKGRRPDYLVVHHMEPDHSAGITAFLQQYPEAVIVSSEKAFSMMKYFFGEDYGDRRRIVKEGDMLCLGKHTLKFAAAPMVHWPEVLVSFEESEKILFSADAFGTFGVFSEGAETTALQNFWLPEARRYYIGIVGKYGAQVQMLFKKLAALDIHKICPLHGPVLSEDLSFYLGKYQTWAQYEPEEEGVVIAYTSVYGHTEEAMKVLAEELRKRQCPVVLFDLARCDMSQAVAAAFQYSKLVLATTTYNGDIFPPMKSFIHHLTERMFQKRTVGLIENGSWMPVAVKMMQKMLESSKNLIYADTVVRIFSALSEESRAQVEQLAEELA